MWQKIRYDQNSQMPRWAITRSKSGLAVDRFAVGFIPCFDVIRGWLAVRWSRKRLDISHLNPLSKFKPNFSSWFQLITFHIHCIEADQDTAWFHQMLRIPLLIVRKIKKLNCRGGGALNSFQSVRQTISRPKNFISRERNTGQADTLVVNKAELRHDTLVISNLIVPSSSTLKPCTIDGKWRWSVLISRPIAQPRGLGHGVYLRSCASLSRRTN